MQKMIKTLSVFILCQFFLISGVCYGGEEDLFSLMVDPDALIAFDLSGSMGSNPGGDYNYQVSSIGSEQDCTDAATYPTYHSSHPYRCVTAGHIWGDSQCNGPFYTSSGSGHSTNCSKAEIAKRAIFALLDDDGNGNLQKKDQESLGIRVAYMRFKECSIEEAIDYSSGCNILRHGFQSLSTNNYYKDLYDKVVADTAEPKWWTPLALQLYEAKQYLNYHKSTDPLKDCRKKFVIFITDGWDTLACGGDYNKPENETGSYGYKRRRATIKAAKEVADAGYKVFVIGFGADMPQTEKNTLEWAAYFAGTDNPLVANSGDVTAISIAADPCKKESCSPDQLSCTNAPNDPGYKALTGYAYLAANAPKLNEALRKAMSYVREARYSFTVSSVSGARITSQNYLYEASFVPLETDPFWQGHLKKYQIDDSGKVIKPAVLDAGDVLRGTTARNMYTYLGGTTPTPFTTGNITPTLLGLSSSDTAGRDKVVGYFRGESATYTQENWRLGDIFHSNPVTIDPPSIYFNDTRSWNAFDSFRQTNKSREWLVVLGANDGQIHAFSTGNLVEKWSFIPPNLLPKLKLISHATEPAPSTTYHQFYVDGPVTVADVWLGSGDGYSKAANEWKTLMVVGLGKGVRESNANNDPTYLWSSSPNCDSDFKRKFNPPHQYYCGYYAFDVTNTSSTAPVYKWRINLANNSQGFYLDEPWSKMAIGRVRIDGNEKWVGFIGGGFTGDNNKKNRNYDDDDFETQAKRGGKGFFVVDLTNGNILWSFTRDNNSNMDYPIPASPLVLDWDNDGFIDTAYIADLGGNIWRFRFCSLADGGSCNTSSWKGSRLFDSTGVERAVFSTPSVAMDASSQLWVFWGTGNKLSPLDTGGQDRFFAVKEKDFTSTFKYTDLQQLTTQAYDPKTMGTKPGWFIAFPWSGEKMLFDSSVFGGMVLFTTYTPTTGTSSCTNTGTGRLYALAMMPITIDGVTYNAGAGLMSKPADTASKDGGNKSITVGSGIPTTPLISQKPKDALGVTGVTDVYVGTSGGGDSSAAVNNAFADLFTMPERGKPCPAGTPPALCRLAQTPPQAQIIHWRDRRLLQ